MGAERLDAEATKVLMKKFLQEFAACGVEGIACDRAGVRRQIHKEWLATQPKYKALFDEIKERFVDGLEKVAIDRAKEKSDALLMFLLKAERREKFGDQANLNVSNPAPITLLFAEGMLNEEDKKLLKTASAQARAEADKPVGGEADGSKE